MGTIVFDFLVPWSVLLLLVGLVVALMGIALWRGLSGAWFRGLAAALLLLAVANPSVQQEDRETLADIVIVVVDETASQSVSDRPAQISQAQTELVARLEARPNTDVRLVTLPDGEGDSGTLMMHRISEVLSKEAVARIAGIILLTDGQIHDPDHILNLPAPMHALLSGHASDWDRRLIIKNAPAFAILDEAITLTLEINDQGQVPENVGTQAVLDISVDGNPAQRYSVEVGKQLELPVTLVHGGMNVIQFSVPEANGELTDRNNSAIVQINGVRDRLRVLLVSGEPHPGSRTWRNLLKSDSSVDLVHFTILRPPDKQDGVPVGELSLIAFPTRELFLDKIDEFDLIIFDRYRRRGILPSLYLDSVREYVVQGGAVLLSVGPDFATADSLFRSPLGEIVPAEPTSRVIEKGFRPQISEIGAKHPVTQGLRSFIPNSEGDDADWGRWFRLIEVEETDGHTVMTDADDHPLLVLNRVGEGRISLIASDHTWLWSRGYEGGGPQLELLRRLAHWMMKEPDLEEEALSANGEGLTMTINRRTLLDGNRMVELTTPNGDTLALPLVEIAPGRFTAEYEAPEVGLYRLKDGEQSTVVALGPAAPREFVNTLGTPEKLLPFVKSTRGGIFQIEEGLPTVRDVSIGRPAAGKGWIGLTPRDAYLTNDIVTRSLIPAWLLLTASLILMLVGWIREGRN